MQILFNAWRDLAHPRAGGSEVLVDRLAQGLHERGHHVTVLCGGPTGDHAYTVRDAGGTYTQYLKAPVLGRRGFADVDLVVDVSNGMSHFSPLWWRGPTLCLVHHVHTEQWAEHFSTPVAALGRMLEGQVLPRMYRRSLFVAMSPSTATDLASLGVDAERIRVLPEAVPAPPFGAERSGEPLHLAVGRLAAHKRIDLLLDIWETVRPRIGGRLVVAGDGPERARLSARGVAGVEFLGAVEEADKHRLFSSAWLLLHPSAREGWGLVVTEAGHHATPAIGFDVPGVRDSIRHGLTGLLASDPSEFADHWERLATDAALRHQLGMGARRFADSFTPEATIDRFEAIAREAVDEQLGSRRRGVRSAGRARPMTATPVGTEAPGVGEQESTGGVSIVIPAFNEERRLPVLLEALGHVVDPEADEILVVDDGSTDRTREVAGSLLATLPRSRVISLDANMGKGAAIRAGVRAARCARLVFMDADMATDLEAFPLLLSALDDADVVLGSRSTEGAVVESAETHRVVMGRVFNRWVRLHTGLDVRDTQCGFKAFRSAAAKLLFSESTLDGFAFDVEVLHLASQLGLTIAEVPIRWTCREGSKVSVARDALAMARDVVKVRRRVPASTVAGLQFPAPAAASETLEALRSDLRSGDRLLVGDGVVYALFPGATDEELRAISRRLAALGPSFVEVSSSLVSVAHRASDRAGLDRLAA